MSGISSRDDTSMTMLAISTYPISSCDDMTFLMFFCAKFWWVRDDTEDSGFSSALLDIKVHLKTVIYLFLMKNTKMVDFESSIVLLIAILT